MISDDQKQFKKKIKTKNNWTSGIKNKMVTNFGYSSPKTNVHHCVSSRNKKKTHKGSLCKTPAEDVASSNFFVIQKWLLWLKVIFG